MQAVFVIFQTIINKGSYAIQRRGGAGNNGTLQMIDRKKETEGKERWRGRVEGMGKREKNKEEEKEGGKEKKEEMN